MKHYYTKNHLKNCGHYQWLQETISLEDMAHLDSLLDMAYEELPTPPSEVEEIKEISWSRAEAGTQQKENEIISAINKVIRYLKAENARRRRRK